MHKMINSYSRVHNERYWDEIGSVLENKEFGRILDIGCGPGLLLKDIYERFNPEEIIGLDLSDVMLEKAREINHKADENGDLILVQQHMQEDSSLLDNLDAIFSSRVMRSFEDQEQIMTSMYNALNPGGYVVILDWSKATIQTYASWFEAQNGEFEDLEPAEIIQYHRNFSQYDISDWHFILKSFDFKIVHSFQLDAVHNCVIAQKPR